MISLSGASDLFFCACEVFFLECNEQRGAEMNQRANIYKGRCIQHVFLFPLLLEVVISSETFTTK